MKNTLTRPDKVRNGGIADHVTDKETITTPGSSPSGSPSSTMGYRTSCVISICFIVFILMHVSFDIRRHRTKFKAHHSRGKVVNHPGYVVASRSLPKDIKSKQEYHELDISDAGDVDVAIFTIRDYHVNELPRTVFCPRWNISITYRNARFNVTACKDADVVMFTSGKGFGKKIQVQLWSQLQYQRNINQLWILSSAEAAINTVPMWPPWNMRNILMNLSSTFSLDSDIPIPYGEYIYFKEPRSIPYRSKLLNDSQNFVVWIASHCPLRTWNRSGIVHELSRYIPVDIYGKCGDLVCDSMDKSCISIIRSYKFYLALENSCCKNYITEKLWEPLQIYDLIPIVLGATKEEYQKIAPPNSFIHVDDFQSIKHLAKYLKTVASNLALYQSYFEWKNQGYIQTPRVYKSIWESDAHSCELLEYVKGIRPTPSGGFDPFGPTWFSGCGACGTQPWLHSYYFSPAQMIYDNIQSASNATQ